MKGSEDNRAPEYTVIPGPAFRDRLYSILSSMYWEYMGEQESVDEFILQCKKVNIVIVDMDGV